MKHTRQLIDAILKEALDPSGRAATDRFATLRDVDRKVSELTMLLDTLPPEAERLKEAVTPEFTGSIIVESAPDEKLR